MSTITPYLWFERDLEQVLDYYMSVFKNARNSSVQDLGNDIKTAEFELEGQKFMALQGGPQFKFTEAISFFVTCEDQAEVDYYWNALTSNGGQESQCGWLKDKYGLSWQIIPKALMETIGGEDKAGAQRVVQAMLQMRKIIVDDLRRAYAG